MPDQSAVNSFHGGELVVQRRAGVQAEAARLAPMLARAELRGGVAAVLTEATLTAFTARDQVGRLWISPLTGLPGFLSAGSAKTLVIDSALPEGDPLHGVRAGQAVGLVVIDFASRRRVRINGRLDETDGGVLTVNVDQAYGNCPQYIQERRLRAAPLASAESERVRPDRVLRSRDIELIQAADTFFLGTTHPDCGNDASHRGGPAGFVRVDANGLWWPDYQGNNMFNSFGNLVVDSAAALLFIDFGTGRTLQLSGAACVEWGDPGTAGDGGHTRRRVRFAVHHVADGSVPLRETDHRPYPRNPALPDM